MPMIERAGARIWWETRGHGGTPVLIIQGLGYPSDASWRLLPGLLTRHTVIVMDNRGAGRSSVPKEQWGVEAMAADAGAVIEAAGLGPAHVIGLSMGGLIAQELALRSPDLVRSLMLGCTSPGGPDAILLRPDVAEMFNELVALPAEQAAWRSARVTYSEATPAADIKADIDVRMARPTSREGYGKQLMATATFEGTLARLRDLRLPVLVLHGTSDLIVPVANADTLIHALPQAQLHLMPGAGHIFTTDATASAVGAMLDFTAECESRVPVGAAPGASWSHPERAVNDAIAAVAGEAH
ncbi:MAG: alpha/beta hydrolase [Dermatophilaceae bacterium]|jgi:3-oxoadipate enol-lactonase|nr:alpha/beta hydrolase [Dermatophilaceae bacterium]MBP9918093.1 alpha/beta hydrolase [Dermatophilaceae bacterium]